MRSPTVSTDASAFNPFLYATVGDDRNGMELTVLSAFARQDVDPWDEAATLSRLPGATALQKLMSMLEALPGQMTLADRQAIAHRLLSLLPNPARRVSRNESETVPRKEAVTRQPDAGRTDGKALPSLAEKRWPHLSEGSLVIIYLALMFIGQWVYLNETATTDEGRATTTEARPAVAHGQSPAINQTP